MDARSVVIGYAMGYNDGLDDGGKGEKPSDDWQPPEWWIPVPEPGPYDIYMLIKATDGAYDGMKANFGLYKQIQSGGWVYGNDAYCDWGDGTEEIYPSAAWTHTYEEQGMYLVHIIGNENAFAFTGSGMPKNLLIFKSGEKIVCNVGFDLGFQNQNALSYIKINNSGGLVFANQKVFQSCNALKQIVANETNVLAIGAYACSNCNGLEQLNFPNCKLINNYAFSNCSSLKTINFPNVTSIGNSAFSGCSRLQKAYFPNCKSIGSQAFYSCVNLQEITVAEDCTFGVNCFQNCPSLYPRPDGSIN